MLTHANPETGMWGSRTPQEGLLQVVNGFYRATRGTFAQFGLPVPYPERVIDTVLQHAQDVRHFAPDRYNACNVLDVAHPLWLTRQTGYRAEEVVTLARKLLTGVLKHWIDGSGFAFAAPNAGSRPGQTTPGLQVPRCGWRQSGYWPIWGAFREPGISATGRTPPEPARLP